ncbi:hypothetical protein [Rhodopirellula baltica]
MNALGNEESDFDEKVVYWVEGQEMPESIDSEVGLVPFNLFAALQGEKPWVVKELLDEMPLSANELEEVMDAVLTQIVILNSNDDKDYLSRFKEFKSILNAVCGLSGEVLTAAEIRGALRTQRLSRSHLMQLRRAISLGFAWSLSDDDELRREALELTALLGEIEDRLRMI